MSWLDILPSAERARMRKRLRSPEAYAESREGIPTVEQLEQGLERQSDLAALSLALELEPTLRDELKKHIEQSGSDQGFSRLLDTAPDDATVARLEAGDFTVSIGSHPETDVDQLVLLPSGNVSEQIPLKPVVSEQYSSQLASDL